MPATAIDTNRLFRALKATGKSEHFFAEDLLGAFDAAQGEGDLVTRGNFDARLDTMRAEMRLELKSGQLQSIYWLAGIVLISNGAVIALLGRVARLY